MDMSHITLDFHISVILRNIDIVSQLVNSELEKMSKSDTGNSVVASHKHSEPNPIWALL